MQNNLRCR